MGPEGYDQIVLVKCLLISQWHGLSDPKLEENLRDRFDALLFAGLNLHCAVRDETAHFRSCNAPVKAGAWDGLRAGVCHQIEGHGLKMKEAKTAIIIPPLIESAVWPRTHIEAPPEDRAEPAAPDAPVTFRADTNAR